MQDGGTASDEEGQPGVPGYDRVDATVFRRDVGGDRDALSRQRPGDPPRAVAVDVHHDDPAPFP